jgi:hypothetical protein
VNRDPLNSLEREQHVCCLTSFLATASALTGMMKDPRRLSPADRSLPTTESGPLAYAAAGPRRVVWVKTRMVRSFLSYGVPSCDGPPHQRAYSVKAVRKLCERSCLSVFRQSLYVPCTIGALFKAGLLYHRYFVLSSEFVQLVEFSNYNIFIDLARRSEGVTEKCGCAKREEERQRERNCP